MFFPISLPYLPLFYRNIPFRHYASTQWSLLKHYQVKAGVFVASRLKLVLWLILLIITWPLILIIPVAILVDANHSGSATE